MYGARRFFQMKFLGLALAALCAVNLSGCAAPVEVTMSSSGKTDDQGNAYICVETNLPDGTELLLTLSNDSYSAQEQAAVVDGQAVFGPLTNGNYPLSAGEYSVDVVMPYAAVQEESVKEVLGKDGKNLAGSLVAESESDGKYIQYNTEWTMPSLLDPLTDREGVLCMGGANVAMLYAALALKDGNGAGPYVVQLSFDRAIYSSTTSDVLIDYTMTTSLNNQKYPQTGGKDACLLLEGLEGVAPKGTIIDDWFAYAPWAEALYDQSRIDAGLAYEYSDEELDRVNTALAQFLGDAWNLSQDLMSSEQSEGHGAADGGEKLEEGEFWCLGKNDTCRNKTYRADDLYCDQCDPDNDNMEG